MSKPYFGFITNVRFKCAECDKEIDADRDGYVWTKETGYCCSLTCFERRENAISAQKEGKS